MRLGKLAKYSGQCQGNEAWVPVCSTPSPGTASAPSARQPGRRMADEPTRLTMGAQLEGRDTPTEGFAL